MSILPFFYDGRHSWHALTHNYESISLIYVDITDFQVNYSCEVQLLLFKWELQNGDSIVVALKHFLKTGRKCVLFKG